MRLSLGAVLVAAPGNHSGLELLESTLLLWGIEGRGSIPGVGFEGEKKGPGTTLFPRDGEVQRHLQGSAGWLRFGRIPRDFETRLVDRMVFPSSV